MSHSLKIGDSNIIEAKSYVGRQTNLSNGCIVGAGCRLTTEETLAENCVVYGGSCDRRQAADRPAPQTLQIDFLSKVFIHYANHMRSIDLSKGSSKLSPPEEACQEASPSFLTPS